MIVDIGLIVIGLLLLVAGGEVLLRGAVGLATLARLTPAVIGLTVVAAGTSVPELAVSAVAAFQDKVDITVGNVVGSNIFNITLILGLAALIHPLAIGGNTVRLEYPALVLVTGLCVAVGLGGEIGRPEAALFLVVYVGLTAYLVWLARRQLNVAEGAEFMAETRELAGVANRPPRLWLCLLLVAGGVVLLAGGAELTVRGAVEVGRQLGLSERVIGLTIIAAGTGLPEVVTSVVSTIRGRDDVAVANVIGSNLFNILGILGINALITPLPISPGIARSDNWWMLGTTVLLFPLLFTGRRINRWEGLVLLAAYGLYLFFLLVRTNGPPVGT
jgi:cation:H+ antiporter